MVSQEYTLFEYAVIAWLHENELSPLEFGLIVGDAFHGMTKNDMARDNLNDRVRLVTGGEKVSPLGRVIKDLREGRRSKDFKPAYCLYFLAKVDIEFKQAESAIEKELFKNAPRELRSYQRAVGVPPRRRYFDSKSNEYRFFDLESSVSSDQENTAGASFTASEASQFLPLENQSESSNRSQNWIAQIPRTLWVYASIAVSLAAATGVLLVALLLNQSLDETLAVSGEKQTPELVQTISDRIPGHDQMIEAFAAEKEDRPRQQFSKLREASGLGHPLIDAELSIAYGTGYGVDMDNSRADEAGERAIKEGLDSRVKARDPEALYLYGTMLVYGIYVDQDRERGEQLLQDAHDLGHARASNKLAQLGRFSDDDKCRYYSFATAAREAGYVEGYLIEAEHLRQFSCPREMFSEARAKKEAVRLLTDASNKRHPGSQNLLGTMYRLDEGMSADPNNKLEAIRLFDLAAKQGLPEAMNSLGAMYANGEGIVESPVYDEKAFGLFMQAALLGNARGEHGLGWMYMQNRGHSREGDADAEAVSWFRKSVAQGFVKAQIDLGLMYQTDRVPEEHLPNYSEAVSHYEMAIAQNSTHAMVSLALLYLDRNAFPDREKYEHEAYQLLTEAEERGETRATLPLGRMYYFNQGIVNEEGRYEKALALFEKAEAQGSVRAKNNIGVIYYLGLGVPENLIKGIEKYQEAADLGDPAAKANLGRAYEIGKGVKQDIEEAIRLYLESAAGDNTWAQYYLAGMYRDGRGFQQNDERAFKWYHTAALIGDSDAQAQLGWMWENHRGVPAHPSNYREAVKWYRAAADQGLAWAQRNLGSLYEKELGVPLDQYNATEAARLYRLAAAQGDGRAAYNLADMYGQEEFGGTPRQRASVMLRLYEQAAKNDYPQARLRLVSIYSTGAAGERNFSLAQEQLNMLIENREIGILSGFFDYPIQALSFTQTNMSRPNCSWIPSFFCFGYNTEELLKKAHEIADLGVTKAEAALAVAYRNLGRCDDMNKSFSKLKARAQQIKTIDQTVYAITEAWIGGGEICKNSINRFQNRNAIYWAAADGDRTAIEFVLNYNTLLENDAPISIESEWILQLENNAIRVDDAKLYGDVGNLFRNLAYDRDGIEEQKSLANAVVWYQRAIDAGYLSAGYNAVEILLRDENLLNEPAKMERILQLVLATHSPKEQREFLRDGQFSDVEAELSKYDQRFLAIFRKYEQQFYDSGALIASN